jgi:acetyl esterase/lipase
MLYFPATESQAPGPAVILCPGGGYKHLVITKMTPTAEWFNERGIHAFILQYRTPRMRDAAFNDAQRAMRILRARAAEWDIDPDKIGIMGSSAGGHLAARVSLHAGAPTYPPVDLIDAENGQPAFTILLYPAYMDRSDGSLRDTFRVHKDLPPTLIISARDDRNHFRSGAVYAEALEAAGAPVQTHFFDSGGHGFSMLNNPDPLSSWPDKMERWLQAIHVID